ncbi:TRAP transporter large permease subunit [Chloroflexota bacterium]
MEFTNWLPIIVLFGGMLIFLVLGLPVAFSMGGVALIAALIFWGPESLVIAATNTYGSMRMFVLIAMPLFIFMAAVLERSGVADNLYEAIRQWLGPLRGSLSMATVFACTVIAAMSGVTTAGIVTMGLIALPIMLKKGYDKSIAIGPIMAGGVLGILIPPSTSFIIYGVLTESSIGRLFAGGLIPGLMLSFLYVSYIGIRCYFQPHLGPSIPKEERISFKAKFVLSRGLILPVLLILGVLGSIFAGVASPTEAAAVGAFGAMACSVINRRFNWQMLKEASYRTCQINAMIMWILFGAFCFTAVFAASGSQKLIQDLILGLNVEPIYVILFMMVSYFILGCFVNEVTMVMITIPVYLPILVSLGFDPVWFGVLFIVNMQMAYLTPPFGFALFYMKGVAPPGVTMLDLYRSIIPFIPLQWTVLLLVMFFPQLALWLPNMVFGLK